MKLYFISLVLVSLAALTSFPAQAQESIGNLQVSGVDITQNGKLFVVRGLQVVAFVGPEGANNRYGKALEHFGSKELEIAKAWRANTIRFQIGEPEMDPQSNSYSPQRVTQVSQGVALARSMGFAVIVSIQDEKATGEERQHQLPTSATVRVLSILTKMFNGDRGIMYELYNEPSFRASPDFWELWKSGGPDPKGRGDVFIGMQQLIDQVRATGSQNIVIVDGLEGATNLSGVPALNDPLHQIVYAVHPFTKVSSPDSWENKFGFLRQQSKALLISEWSAKTGGQQKWCEGMNGQELAATARDFLNYIKARNIGVVGFTLDMPGTIVKDFNGTPTSYSGVGCKEPGDGPGELLIRHFSN